MLRSSRGGRDKSGPYALRRDNTRAAARVWPTRPQARRGLIYRAQGTSRSEVPVSLALRRVSLQRAR
ncbi:MAG: hypothetical protein ABI406_09510, partial [Ktedonobacteraceae bacterium]